jgi:tetratricopeptide (TPR) repeat protein
MRSAERESLVRAIWLSAAGLGVVLAAGATGMYLSRHAGEQPDQDKAVEQTLKLARWHLDSARYTEALRLLQQVSDECSLSAEASLLRGVAFWRLNRWQAAEDAWKRALQLDQTVPEAAWHLLSFYFVEQRWREAEELALALYPTEPDPRDRTLLLLELVREDTERLSLDATVQTLEPVVLVEPQNYHALRALGLSYAMLQRVNEGVELIERAIALRPAEPDAWFSLVSCLSETGQVDYLGSVWKRVPAAATKEPRFQRSRGMWAEAIGDPVEAERAYRAALENDSADRKAYYQLARLLRSRGADLEALEHENQARRLDNAREELALCYAKAGQQHDNPSAELCRQFSQWCRVLGRLGQAELWEQEASQRADQRH